MATEDHSRKTFDPRYNRRQVVGQVGRILTDEDVTAIGDLASDERAVDRIGIIGAQGTSNDGFRISSVSTAGGVIDFTIEAGDYWIGGHRATLHARTTFRLQSDWLQRTDLTPPTGARHDLAVLELFAQPVEATEQNAGFDPGLGGTDTVAHLRMMARVRLMTNLAEGDCHDLWSEVVADWAASGEGTLVTATHELIGNGVLTVGFTNTGAPAELCAPDIDEGFLGAADRAIRVQMVSGTQFVWGFENGGRLMKATVDATGSELTLITDPKDEAHWPSVDQVIEVLPWGAVDFNGEKLAGEVDATHFTTVGVGYDPDTGILTMNDPLPAGFNTAWQSRTDAAALETTNFGQTPDPAYVYVRVWDRGEDRASPALLNAGPNVVLGLTGLTASITGTVLRAGDAWNIAARPFAPNQIAPWELRVGAEPIARRRYVAPIGHLIWAADGSVDLVDCRTRFRPLTRLNDCITLRVGDGTTSHGDFDRIQAAVDALPSAGGRILVLPGTYDEHVTISLRENIRIEGCGDRTRVVPATADSTIADDTAIFSIEGSTNITLQDMAIDAPAQLAVAAMRAVVSGGSTSATNGVVVTGSTLVPSQDVTLRNLTISHYQRGGVWLAVASGATVQNCRMTVDGTLDGAALAETNHRPSLTLQGARLWAVQNRLGTIDFGKPLAPALGGMTIAGGSSDVRITGNLIEGCYGNGITLGSVIYVEETLVTDDVALADAFASAWGTVQVTEGFTISDDNCFGLDPNPPGRDPNGGTRVFVPVPDGELDDIFIADNRIRTMGGHGIGVRQYFDLDNYPFFITVENIVILRNEITGVLSGENLPYPPEMQLVAAWAAIALADVSRAEIRENRIEDNGRIHTLPAVGIFALFAEAMEIVENTISDTGLRADEIDGTGVGAGGWRGGIVINQVRPSPRDFDVLPIDDGPMRSDGSSALVVHGNSVRAPQGRALTAFGLGPMHVTDNRLVSQSGTMSGIVLAAFNLRRFGQLSLTGLLVNALYTIVQEAPRPNATLSHILLSVLGGDVVALGNLGMSNEFYLQLFGFSDRLINGDMELGFDAPGDLMVGGDIMFNDNQVRLDGLDGQSSFGVSAVALASLDNVMVQSNQISLDLDGDFMGINLLALGFTVHASSNRLKEPMLNCFCSALTWGTMNTTAINQATHCILAEGFSSPALFFDQGNTEMVQALSAALGLGEGGLCDRLRKGFRGGLREDFGNFAVVTNG